MAAIILTSAMVSACEQEPSSGELVTVPRSKRQALPEQLGPAETVARFHQHATAGELDRAMALLLWLDGSEDSLRDRLTEGLSAIQEGDLRLEVGDERIDGDMACVVVIEHFPGVEDDDPMYLMRTDDGWRLLPTVPGNDWEQSLTPGQMRSYQVVRKWYDSERKR